MALRRRIRWVVRHGLIRRTVQRQMRAGDLGSRLMIDPAIREDPFPYYDELRAQGHVVASGFALMSAHHEVCLAVLRSPDFGQRRLDLIPPAPHEARRPGVLGPIEPPSMLVTDPPRSQEGESGQRHLDFDDARLGSATRQGDTGLACSLQVACDGLSSGLERGLAGVTIR